MRDQSLLNTVGIADALGTSRPTASRAAARGEYGKPVVRKGTRRKFYRLAAIEKAAGRKFTPDQLAKAKTAHEYTGPNVAMILRGFIGLALKHRDAQWIAALGITKFTPPNLKTNGVSK